MSAITIALAILLVAAIGFNVIQQMRGKLTLDLGWGRTLHDLGPLVLRIDAPRALVHETIAGPYLGRTPRSMREHLQVIEQGDDFALAAHYTEFALYTAETVEVVRFEPPELVTFRHVRGPVPHVVEGFELRAVDGGTTELEYSGELGMDLWAFGSLLARHWVVPTWEETVDSSLDQIAATAERRAKARRRRSAEPDT